MDTNQIVAVVILIISGIVINGILVGVLISHFKKTKKLKKCFIEGVDFVERELTQAGFNISRKVGNFVKKHSCASFFLYVDDVNKKWVITSPMDRFIDKIRNYEDLLAYDFFDSGYRPTLMDKIFKINNQAMQGFETAVGAGIGIGVGGIVSGGSVTSGLIGGVGGGMGFRKLAELKGEGENMENATESYGIAIKTADLVAAENVNNTDPVLIYDFMTINDAKPMFLFYKKRRIGRIHPAYVSDIQVISEMEEVFNYIYRSSE